MYELVPEKALCAHCHKPVTTNDLVMWVDDVEPFGAYFVHTKFANSECDPAITKFLNDLFPEHNEKTLQIDDFLRMAADVLGE